MPSNLLATVNNTGTPPHPHLDRLLRQASVKSTIPVAVAYPCDVDSLCAVMQAAAVGLIRPLLVGPRQRIEATAAQAGIDLTTADIRATADDPHAAAEETAVLCRDGVTRAIMKGSLHSDALLGAVMAHKTGLRGDRRASHAFVMDIPGLDRPLLMTDCVVNIFPDLMAKSDIAQNAIELAHAIGIAKPRVAVLSAVETVNPAIPGTIDAAALAKMADRGQIIGGIVDGPLAYDNAISLRSAQNKGIASEVAGRSDVLLVPNLEAGNMIYKQLVYMADAECAGIVLGMRVPIILTSRSDSVVARIASCALAALIGT